MAQLLDEELPNAEFEGHKLTRAGNTSFSASREQLLNSLKETLASRFDDVEEGVMKACSCIADFANWPVEDVDGGIFSNHVSLVRLFGG